MRLKPTSITLLPEHQKALLEIARAKGIKAGTK